MLRLLIEGDPVGAVLAAAKLELRVLDLGVGALPLVGVLGRRGGDARAVSQTASLEPGRGTAAAEVSVDASVR